VKKICKGQKLYKEAKKIIPGGTQLLSKRPEMFLPDLWPVYFSKAQGIEITDIAGKKYLDFSIMGVGACILGYADEDVDKAVGKAVDDGVASTLNTPEEVDLAKLLCDIHPWADMTRFARSGGEAVSMAIRIARAYTNREKIAFCGYHGWTDWYLAGNLTSSEALNDHLMEGLPPNGVPRSLKNTAFPFHYNKIDELKDILTNNKGEIGAIIMEPQRGNIPEPGFLEEVRSIADETKAVLIFDEVTTGFREKFGGIHLFLGVHPDIAVFAKAMANGYAMSAVIGREEIMQAAQQTFISSTNWTERIGPTAALATINKLKSEEVNKSIVDIGKTVKKKWSIISQKHDLKINIGGLDSLPQFSFPDDQELKIATYFSQLMLDEGYLATDQFKPSFAHDHKKIDAYAHSFDNTFAKIKNSIQKNNIDKKLKSKPARRGFYRLT